MSEWKYYRYVNTKYGRFVHELSGYGLSNALLPILLTSFCRAKQWQQVADESIRPARKATVSTSVAQLQLHNYNRATCTATTTGKSLQRPNPMHDRAAARARIMGGRRTNQGLDDPRYASIRSPATYFTYAQLSIS